jgi:hypothetical protein
MFIYSVRAGTLKFFAVVCVALTVLITLIAFVPTYTVEDTLPSSADAEIRYDKIRNEQDVAEFLAQFGWSVEATPLQVTEVKVPDSFDKIMAGYNELQKSQGLDLSRCKNKTVTRYTMRVSNYSSYDGEVYANVLVRHGRVVGGDVCSAETDGFVHGFAPERK